MVSTTQIQALILAALPGAEVQVYDPNQDGQHFSAVVIAPQFSGIAMVQQHRLVNEALKTPLASGEIHALQLKTYSPEQWQQSNVQFG
ncbi:MAG: BolA/IbaG family iron-sulfur metabolism protein [Pseudanabaenaceae cyanobacterium bins.68]|nr:BolA/IbaG family iron-sulfur metabolism protein [Pseudanabaenaceae cyanobacterium bins.68]